MQHQVNSILNSAHLLVHEEHSTALVSRDYAVLAFSVLRLEPVKVNQFMSRMRTDRADESYNNEKWRR